VTEDCLTPVISTHGDQTSKQEAEQISNQTVVTRSSSCDDSECVVPRGSQESDDEWPCFSDQTDASFCGHGPFSDKDKYSVQSFVLGALHCITIKELI
jgi:hypothetical protein